MAQLKTSSCVYVYTYTYCDTMLMSWSIQKSIVHIVIFRRLKSFINSKKNIFNVYRNTTWNPLCIYVCGGVYKNLSLNKYITVQGKNKLNGLSILCRKYTKCRISGTSSKEWPLSQENWQNGNMAPWTGGPGGASLGQLQLWLRWVGESREKKKSIGEDQDRENPTFWWVFWLRIIIFNTIHQSSYWMYWKLSFL